MARVTVEDCILLVPNRFDLVMMNWTLHFVKDKV
ncbi:MAG: DNA-directed RNA polymerase subunit omega, partial [Chitinophagia bacterium]|nr:DNA-directed RNA polymerase subunit omega [Chitinophagia bacterium]